MKIPKVDRNRPRLRHLFERYPQKVRDRFWKFHQANEPIWRLFVKKTFGAMEKGHKKYGARRIAEEIRWDIEHGVVKGVEVFEVNDDYVPIYARLFMWYWPQFMGFFEFRKVTSKGKMSEEERRRRGEKPWEYLH